MGFVHINAPKAVKQKVIAGTCPDCKKRTRFLTWFYEWYGTDATCLRCGRKWQDAEWMPLPFMRGARKNNIDEAKDRWRRGMGHNARDNPPQPEDVTKNDDRNLRSG